MITLITIAIIWLVGMPVMWWFIGRNERDVHSARAIVALWPLALVALYSMIACEWAIGRRNEKALKWERKR